MASPNLNALRASIGKYKILSRLGKGGMGDVYKAHDPSLDRVVALKTIRADVAQAGSLDRFYKEGRASGRLRHPLIVTVHEMGVDEGGTVFLVMEYLEGQCLASALRAGVLSFEAKIRILILVLDALDYAHRQGVIHRDIKPSNVQVLPDGSIKLLDFGVARILTADEMTRTGNVVGTPYYMAPEQLMGRKVDHRADVYSTGAMAYELLTERRAFSGDSLTEVILKVMSQSPEPMENAWCRALPDAERIVMKAMQKAPELRYATAGEMAADFRAFLQAHLPAMARVEEELKGIAGGPVGPASPGPLDSQATDIVGGVWPTVPGADATERISKRELLRGTQTPPPLCGEAACPTSDGDQRTEIVPGPHQTLGMSTHLGRRLALPAILLASLVLLAAGGFVFLRQVKLGASQIITVSRGFQVVEGSSAAAAPRDANAPDRGSFRVISPPPTGDPQRNGVAGRGNDELGASSQGTSALGGSPGTRLQADASQLGRSGRPGAGIHLQPSASGWPNRELVALLTEAVQARGCEVRGDSSRAGPVAMVRGEVTLRSSPFAGVSATSADYVGVLEIQHAGARPRRFDYNGHAMEFGENVARTTALKDLAGKMAERLCPVPR